MSRTRAAWPIALAAIAVLALAGCTPPEEPEPSASVEPVPSDEPVFASDDEALQAAVGVFEEYVALVDTSYHGGALDLAAIEQLTTDSFAEREIPEIEAFSEQGLVMIGLRQVRKPSLDSWEESSPTSGSVTFVACFDLTGIRVVDANGEEVENPNRLVPIRVETVYDDGNLEISDFQASTIEQVPDAC